MRFLFPPVARRARVRSVTTSVPARGSSTRNVICSNLMRWSRGAALLFAGPHCSVSLSVSAQATPRRWQSSSGFDRDKSGLDSFGSGAIAGELASEDPTGLQSELVRELEGEGNLSVDAALSQPLGKADLQTPTARIRLEKIERPPGRFDMLTNSLVYRWQTTASQARKVTGPMREWATELKYRTGVHMEVEPTFPDRIGVPAAEGGYATADEVELTVYLFGSERGIFNCRQLMEAALDQDPAYVRLGVFRRKPGNAAGAHNSSNGGNGSSSNNNGGSGGDAEVEWLMLRRINRDLRPPDIPPISLKLPGKWTMLFEQFKEAAVRTLWEETGITVDPNSVFPTARLNQENPTYYWRVPVYYFMAEVPYDVEVRGPQVGLNTYMHHWDAQLLRQSPDPIDRAWAQLADPETGCAWMKVPMIDELQRPLRGENYMATRYTPPPYSGLNSVVGFPVPAAEASGAEGADAAATATKASTPTTESAPTATAVEAEAAQAKNGATTSEKVISNDAAASAPPTEPRSSS